MAENPVELRETVPGVARNFSSFLVMVEEGRLHGDLTEGLRDLVAKIHDAAREGAGKAEGAVKLSLKLKLAGGVIEVIGDCKFDTPKAPRSRSIFWATPENNLTAQNPRQGNLFRDVTGPAAPGDVRSVT
jgi:hypothetical protein